MAHQIPFGRAMRTAHFAFDPSYTPLNHGSFGTYPTAILQQLHACQHAAESRPDTWIRYEVPVQLDASRIAVAKFLNILPEEVVLVPNATTAVNVVLRSLKYEQGDVIIYFSTLYGACEKTIEYLSESTGVAGERVEIRYPLADDEVMRKFEERVQRVKDDGKRPRVAVFDTISSFPGVRVPWERLVQSCKAHGVMSLVDGAHGIGHIDLQHLGTVGPDFFTSNCHKWLFVPRGCAIFHVPIRNQYLIRSSLPTSHSFVPLPKPGQPEIFNPLPSGSQNSFVGLFEFTATIDVSPYLCINEAINFRRNACGGEEEIMRYNSNLAQEGGKQVAALLHTKVMGNEEGTCFTNIKLPLTIGYKEGEVKKSDMIVAAAWMANRFVHDYNTYMGVYLHGDSFWVRISGQIYLEMADFLRGAEILRELCQRVQHGEYLESK